jgi:predicted DNA-binding ribbon-helix-helix protein
MNLKFDKTKGKIIGSLRIEEYIFDKIARIAKENKVTNQDVIRSILKEVVDNGEI